MSSIKSKVTKSDLAMNFEGEESPRYINMTITLNGKLEEGEYSFLGVFNGQIVMDERWCDGLVLNTNLLPVNVKDSASTSLAIDNPLIFLLRPIGGKGSKDPDPLLNIDNKAGGTLLPLVLGEAEIFIDVPMVYMDTGKSTGCTVTVFADAGAKFDERVPLTLTMISANCMPPIKEGSVYISALGLDGLFDNISVNFGMSLSTPTAHKTIWANASAIGYAAAANNIPDDDIFYPPDLDPIENSSCPRYFWHAVKRVLVDPIVLRERIKLPFLIEVAGVPRVGKLEARGHFLGFIDARVLLEPGQYGVTTSAKLIYYSEADLPNNVGPLLEFPPTSAKLSGREGGVTTDEQGHPSYVTIRFDLMDPLMPKSKIAALFDKIGYPPPEGKSAPLNELYVEPHPEDPTIDIRKIRKECGALSVHKELSSLACRGSVPMNQGIKRTAANRLLSRVRSMLKQFPPGECSTVEWQDTVTAQHSACRRAITASFCPQAPPLRTPPRAASARARMVGDKRIADKHLEVNLKIAPTHPRSLLSKTLRCLEARNDSEALNYIMEALSAQTRNRYLLWIYGSQKFDKGEKSLEEAAAAFRVAVKGDYSDGISNAIGWAALHAAHHYNKNYQAAFVAAKKMRKSYELPRDWKGFIKRWESSSGEEEIFWYPSYISTDSPMLISAAFFLCLRGYKFSELMLLCCERNCATKGSRQKIINKQYPEVNYLRAASLLLRRQFDKALQVTEEGIAKYGPAPMLSQMRATCLLCAKGWDGECENALRETERSGADPSPGLLLQAAMGGIKTDSRASLQRAARAHKLAPCAHSALIIGRIYQKLNEDSLAERWAAVAVKLEPFLADGWAFLGLLAIYQRNVDKARTLLRTARQSGEISADLEEELRYSSSIIQAQGLPETLMRDICLCEYY